LCSALSACLLYAEGPERFQDQENRPHNAFQKAQHAHPEGGGAANEVDAGPDEAQPINGICCTVVVTKVVVTKVVLTMVVLTMVVMFFLTVTFFFFCFSFVAHFYSIKLL